MADATRPCGLAVSDNSAGAHAWSSPENVYAEDGNAASCSLAPDGESEYLWCTDFDFASAGIPGGATILGVVLAVDRRCSLGEVEDAEVRLIKAGVLVGDDKALSGSSNWPASFGGYSYGDTGDTWSAGLTVADVENADFGVAMRVREIAASPDYAIADVDYVVLTVTYAAVTVDPPGMVVRSASSAARRLTRVRGSKIFGAATLVDHVTPTVEHFPQTIYARAARDVASRPQSQVFAPIEGVAAIASDAQYHPPVVVVVRRAPQRRHGRSQVFAAPVTAGAGTCDCPPVGAVLVRGVGYAAEVIGVHGDGMVFPYRAELVATGVNLAAELVAECEC